MLPWWTAAILANVAIIASEYVHRSVPAGTAWVVVLPRVLPLYLIAQYFLFKCFSGAPHWFTASVVFTVGNSIMRVIAVSTYAPGEVTDWRFAAAGLIGMIGCALLVKSGLR